MTKKEWEELMQLTDIIAEYCTRWNNWSMCRIEGLIVRRMARLIGETIWTDDADMVAFDSEEGTIEITYTPESGLPVRMIQAVVPNEPEKTLPMSWEEWEDLWILIDIREACHLPLEEELSKRLEDIEDAFQERYGYGKTFQESIGMNKEGAWGYCGWTTTGRFTWFDAEDKLLADFQVVRVPDALPAVPATRSLTPNKQPRHFLKKPCEGVA